MTATALDISAAPQNWGACEVVVTSCLSLDASAPLSLDRLLRRLEVVRQMLGVRWNGTAGTFAGFETLDMDTPTNLNLSSGDVTFSARLVGVDDSIQRVELLAVHTDGEPPRPRVLSRAVALTDSAPSDAA